MDGLNAPLSDIDSTSRRFVSRRMAPLPPSRFQRLLKWLPVSVFVFLPTLLAGVYVFCFAADQYVSEAKFVVRGAAGTQPSLLSGLLQTAGVSRAQDDTFAVQDYILSRDALEELNKTLNVRDVFNRPEADVLSRFPLPYMGETFEHLYKHYLGRVAISYDSTTGVTQLTARAFRADDAAMIARSLLTGGEQLVNRMNERQRQNTMRDARREVSDAEARVQRVAADLASYRMRESLLDPNKQSVSMLQAITDMTARMTQSKTQLGELQRSSPQSPLIESLKRRIAVMQGQVDEARARITGANNSMVPQITEFDALTLQREFADRQLSSAIAFLDTARLNADRQQLYLDQIVKPNVADYALYPKRFVDTAIVFATLFVLFTIARLLIAGAREHRSV